MGSRPRRRSRCRPEPPLRRGAVGPRPGQTAPIHITTAQRRRPRQGLLPHCSPLPCDEVTTHNAIPTTTVPRTILDQAATATTRQVERMINEADVQQLWDRLSLDDLLDRYPNRAGSAAVRQALRRRREGASVTKSELEEMLIELLDELGLPRPRVNESLSVDGTLYEPDCLWPEQRPRDRARRPPLPPHRAGVRIRPRARPAPPPRRLADDPRHPPDAHHRRAGS